MMKRFTKFIIFSTIFVFSVSNISVAKANPIVAINPSSAEVTVGEEFSLEIIITGEDIVDMAAWNGTLIFDPGILSLQNATIGGFASPNAIFIFNEPTPGELIMLEFQLGNDPVSGQGSIAVIDFKALKPGHTLI